MHHTLYIVHYTRLYIIHLHLDVDVDIHIAYVCIYIPPTFLPAAKTYQNGCVAFWSLIFSYLKNTNVYLFWYWQPLQHIWSLRTLVLLC